MKNTVTQVTNRSYGSRIMGSIKGIFIGFLLIIFGVGLLWWNEGRTVKQFKALEEVGGNVVATDSSKIDESLEGQLIHTTGAVETEQILTDQQFYVEQTALALNRKVEMYQWEEKSEASRKNNVGGSETTKTTYKYNKVWSEKSIDSSTFHQPSGHTNPAKNLSSQSFYTDKAVMGAYNFPEEKINKLRPSQSLNLDDVDLANFPEEFNQGDMVGNTVYSGNQKSPKIGDYRVTFSYIPSGTEASIIGEKMGSNITDYLTANGTNLLLVHSGIKTSAMMVETEQKNNTILAWVLRALGTLAIFTGINAIVAPLVVLASVLPILGRITGGITGIIAFVLSLFISLITIGFAWVFYRPLIGVSILALGVLVLLGLFFVRHKKAQSQPTASQAQPDNVLNKNQASAATSTNSRTPNQAPSDSSSNPELQKPNTSPLEAQSPSSTSNPNPFMVPPESDPQNDPKS